MWLPIEDILDGIAEHLRSQPNLVVIAPPGAGKTTRIPQVLIDRGIAKQRVLMLEPRRLAAVGGAARLNAAHAWATRSGICGRSGSVSGARSGSGDD